MDERIIHVDALEEKLLSEDASFAEYHRLWKPLAKFLVDYEYLKGMNRLTQNDIASRSKTTQSAISRLIRMKGKPTYTLLHRVSEAVGGNLFVTPLADMTVTLPFDLHVQAVKLAEAQHISVTELMQKLLRKSISTHPIASEKSHCEVSEAPNQ